MKCSFSTAPWNFLRQRRYVLVILAFFGYGNIYSLRSNMSIAVVAMTEDRFEILENGTKINIGPEFTWENKLTGFLLSAFFYGYITTQLLGGYFATRFGGKRIFGTGIAVTALVTIVSPWLAEVSVYALMVARILTGVFEGMTYSSVYSVYAKWLPPVQRTRLITIIASGVYAGTVFSMYFYAYISSIKGWRSIFWISGGLGLVWNVFWFWIQAESPEEDKHITEKERKFIIKSLEVEKVIKNPKVPWCSVVTSKPLWALTMVLTCETWGFYTMLTMLPKYFKDVFHFNLADSGFLSALPYLVMGIVMQIIGHIADWIVNRNMMTKTNTRKMFVIVGFSTQAVFLMGAAFCPEVTGTVFCLVVAVSFGALGISVVAVNSLELAPRFSGIVFGFINTFSTLSGIISPTVAGYVVSTKNPTVEQWRIVFYITAALYLFGAVFYTVFGSGDIQPWSILEDEVEKPEKSGYTENNYNKSNMKYAQDSVE